MDEEERYWCRLERIYVHDVYESISSQYDEFLKYAKIINNSINLEDGNGNGSENDLNPSDPSTPRNALSPQSSIKHAAAKQLNLNLKKKKRIPATRRVAHKPWPNVTNFLLQLEPYSLVADVGCGDGKYLNLNKSVMTLGCDRSTSLCNLAAVKYQPFEAVCDRNQLAVCDNLALPFRSQMFDAVISIGVVHHFSSPKRRVQAVKELARILRPGGKIMIYVWAMEQRVRKFNCQDVLVPMIDTKKAAQPSKFLLQRNLSNNSTAYSDESNDESENVCNRSQDSEASKSILKARELNNSPDGDSTSQLNLSAKNLDLNISTSSESVRTASSDAERSGVSGGQSTPRLEGDDESPVNEKQRSPSPSRTFITNVKQFLSKRFSSNNLKDIHKMKQDAATAIATDLNNNVGLGNLEKNPSTNSLNGRTVAMTIDPMERYRQILEDHKDLLPKDFTIRKFPFSSCEDTFDPKSLTPSPQLPDDAKITFDLNSNVVAKNEAPEAPAANPPEPETTNGNSLNKRFYHVFKKNELDDLIKDNCADLVKTSSYNDHGNWCWVGHKLE